MKITKYEPGLTAHVPGTPSVGASMHELGQAADAFRSLGSGIAQSMRGAAKIIEEVEKVKKEKRQEQEFNEAVTSAEEEWQFNKMEFDKTNPNPDTYFQDSKIMWDTITKEHEDKIKDPDARKAYRGRMVGRWLTISGQTVQEANQRWLDKESASRIDLAQRKFDLALKAETKTDFELHKAAMIDIIRGSVPLIGETKTLTLENTYSDKLDKERQAAVKDQLLTRVLQDPTMAHVEIMSGRWDELNEADREVLRTNAVTHERAWLAQKVVEEERVRQENKRKEENELDIKLITGRLTQEDVLKSQYADKRQYEAWRLTKEVTPIIKSNFEVLAKLREGVQWIETPKDFDEYVKLLAEASKADISGPDAEQLLEKAMNRAGGVENEYIKRVHKEFRAELAPHSDVLGLPHVPEEEEAVSRAQIILDQEITLARKRGKPLTGIEIYNKGREILHMPELKVNKIGAIKKRAEEERNRRREETKPPPPPRKENETVDEYLKRIGLK